MVYLADMNIGLMIMIIWVVLSWLGGSKKKKRAAKGAGITAARKPSGLAQMFRDLGKQFEASGEKNWDNPFAQVEDPGKMKQDVVSPVTRIHPVSSVENSLYEEPTPKPQTQHVDIDDNVDVNYSEETGDSVADGLHMALQTGKQLRRVILLKEILGTPRAMRPYRPDFRD